MTNTEANAVNQLVIDMKAAGIWTAMKAVYPMVGSSAASCAQNLKSSSFTGTFSSGWTFSSTGATPNGTSAYMDTTLIPNTSLSASSAHLSFYSRTSVAGAQYEFARGNYGILVQYGGNTFYVNLENGGSYAASTTNTDGKGFYIGSRLNNTTVQGFKNNSKIINSALASTLATTSLYIGGNGIASNYSTKECIGDGLTDTQAADFYTCVQTFNTTLSRQIAP
ncbi:MAG: hypothetical protein EBR30_21625 [Cytophagia bacterium]|nr:hypothetical protein [Cytophagia bacterium]